MCACETKGHLLKTKDDSVWCPVRKRFCFVFNYLLFSAQPSHPLQTHLLALSQIHVCNCKGNNWHISWFGQNFKFNIRFFLGHYLSKVFKALHDCITCNLPWGLRGSFSGKLSIDRDDAEWVSGQMEREEINEKLSMLGRRMEELKLEIHSATTATSATFANFEPSFDVTATLSDKVKAVSDEMQELSDKIETEVRNFSWFFV